ncbi:MAG: hypothetical protein WC291_08945 [Thermodesulfovibrionales bacterium]
MKREMVLRSMVMLMAVLVFGYSPAVASTELYDDTVSGCTANNCSSIRLPGTVMSFSPSAGNWVANVFAAPNECLRLDVTLEGADLEMVVIAPNGTVYRNDDRTATDNRPLVKIPSAPNDGWYTVHIAQFNGAPVNADFILLYGRYRAGNPNCAGAQPFAAAGIASEEEWKQDSGVTPPPAGAPGSK